MARRLAPHELCKVGAAIGVATTLVANSCAVGGGVDAEYVDDGPIYN